MPNIFAAHGLSGCNKVCSYFGNGKKTVINVLNTKNINLSSIQFPHEPLENYLKQGINFLLLFYDQSKVETLNDAQKKMQKYSIEKGKLGTPKLESLVPTHESFFQNLKRTHLLIAVWRCLLNADPLTVDINLHGWAKEGETKYIIPLTVAPDVCLVPEEIMKSVQMCLCLKKLMQIRKLLL